MEFTVIGIIVGAILAIGFAAGIIDEEEETSTPKITPEPEPILPPSPQPDDNDIPLQSEVGIDYSKLQQLLAAKQYRQADLETFKMMSMAVLQVEDGWFEESDIARFPCADLQTINQLWLHYSGGHFGFSVQKEIYDQLEGNYEQTAERLGWREKGDWQDYVDLTKERLVPKGYLPSIFASKTAVWFSRAEDCGL
jgi:hypothetical protein